MIVPGVSCVVANGRPAILRGAHLQLGPPAPTARLAASTWNDRARALVGDAGRVDESLGTPSLLLIIARGRFQHAQHRGRARDQPRAGGCRGDHLAHRGLGDRQLLVGELKGFPADALDHTSIASFIAALPCDVLCLSGLMVPARVCHEAALSGAPPTP